MGLRVHLNCAITLDGCLGGPGRTPLKISNAEDLLRVHRLRAASDAILVGVGTVVADDPKLTVKWDLLGRRPGREPLRVVLDPGLRTPPGARVRDGTAPSLFIARRSGPERRGWPVLRVPSQGKRLDLKAALRGLAARGVRRLMVEGGSRTITTFLEDDLVDRATIFVAPRVLGVAQAPRLTEGGADLRDRLRLVSARKLGDGALLAWERA